MNEIRDNSDANEFGDLRMAKQSKTRAKVNATPGDFGICCPYCTKAATFRKSSLLNAEIKLSDIQWDDKKKPKWV